MQTVAVVSTELVLAVMVIAGARSVTIEGQEDEESVEVGMSIIAWVVLGAIAGWLAGLLVKGDERLGVIGHILWNRGSVARRIPGRTAISVGT